MLRSALRRIRWGVLIYTLSVALSLVGVGGFSYLADEFHAIEKEQAEVDKLFKESVEKAPKPKQQEGKRAILFDVRETKIKDREKFDEMSRRQTELTRRVEFIRNVEVVPILAMPLGLAINLLASILVSTKRLEAIPSGSRLKARLGSAAALLGMCVLFNWVPKDLMPFDTNTATVIMRVGLFFGFSGVLDCFAIAAVIVDDHRFNLDYRWLWILTMGLFLFVMAGMPIIANVSPVLHQVLLPHVAKINTIGFFIWEIAFSLISMRLWYKLGSTIRLLSDE